MFLGIDAGGTHTDAVLVHAGRVLAVAKVPTCHEDLPSSIRAVLRALAEDADLSRVERVTLGTTLAVNAIVQGRADRVELVLTAGPGLSPARFALGDQVYIVPGGLDHRGVEVVPLDVEGFTRRLRATPGDGPRTFAVVGKFSPRNPAHEEALGAVCAKLGAVSQGHQLSGQLNFPRRIASTYYNAAVGRLHGCFLDAVEAALAEAGIQAPVRLLKADGGAVALPVSRQRPVESILSGPAASVMGAMALGVPQGDSLLLDMGGTTTDIALFADGSPVVDREGMLLHGRRTLVRALASVSVGVGGDSRLRLCEGTVRVGPVREGPAAAFGGARATFLDVLNLRGEAGVGDVAASRRAVTQLATAGKMTLETLCHAALDDALKTIFQAAQELLERVNARPVYTLAALLEERQVRPEQLWMVGAPAALLQTAVAQRFRLPVTVPPYADVANAIGAALTLPTASLELTADTGRGILRAPALDWQRRIGRQFTLEEACTEARQLLERFAREAGAEDGRVEVTDAELFAVLDDRGHSGRDMRVCCQLVPGITERVAVSCLPEDRG